MPTNDLCFGTLLDNWLNRLDEKKFKIGVRERLLVQTLFAQLSAAGELSEALSLEDRLGLAGPLVCTQPEQQQKYASLLKDFVQEQLVVATESQRPKPCFRHAIFLIGILGFGMLWLVWPSELAIEKPIEIEQLVEPTPQFGSTNQEPVEAPSKPSSVTANKPQDFQSESPRTSSAPLVSSEATRISLLAFGGISLIGLAWLTWRQWRRELYLQETKTDQEVEERFLNDPDPVEIEFSPTTIRRASRIMRQRYEGEREILDVPATLRATMLAGSAMSVRYSALSQTPEYLVLIDQRHPADHHTVYCEALIAALVRNGVVVQIQYFEGSPQSGCWGVRSTPQGYERGPLTSFSDLASRFMGHRLLMFAETQALIDEADGSPRAWTRYVKAFPQRAWFTPMPLASWGQLEQVADAQGFLVLPIQPESLTTMANWFSAGQLGLQVGADWPFNYPAMLRGEEIAWVVRQIAPPTETQETLLFQLRNYLGLQRFQWLCACALSPSITPAMTLVLSREIITEPRGLALGIAAIGALPWFRHASMPRWLKEILSDRLHESHQTHFRKIMEKRLDSAIETAGSRLVTIAERRRRLFAWLRRGRGMARDVVFVNFLHTGLLSKLALKVPEGLRRRIFLNGVPAYGVTAGVRRMLVAGLVIGMLALPGIWDYVTFPIIASYGGSILPGHWRPGWNEKWPAGIPVPNTAGSWQLTDLEKEDGRFVGLAISGGGSRAANFGAAVMLELQERHLLERVDVISGVSGGTLPAVYYGLSDKAGAFTEPALREALGYDFQSSWIRRWFLPQNILRYWLTEFTRSDIMVQVFNNRLFHEATFGDLHLHPKILLNSTVRNDHTRFTFTDERFERLHSALAPYQVANAVISSSAFPGSFQDVTLQRYMEPPQYLNLYDGAMTDSLGVSAITEYLNRNIVGTSLKRLFPNGCLIIIIDATPASEHPELNTMQSSRSSIDYLVDANLLDAMDAILLESRRSLLLGMGIPVARQDQEIRGRLPVNDREQCGCEVLHVALRQLMYAGEDMDGLAERVTQIKTKFWIGEEEQNDLFTAAKLLMKRVDEKKLLTEESLKASCAVTTSVR
jgi:predicted acylesterase/phospholipase RssA